MAGLLDNNNGFAPGLLGNFQRGLAQIARQDPDEMRIKAQRQQVLQRLGAGASLGDVATKLFQVGDIEGGLGLTRLGDLQAQRQFLRDQETRRQFESDRSFKLEEQKSNEPKIFGSGEGGYYMLPRGPGAAPAQSEGRAPGTPTPLAGGATQIVPPRQSIDREQLKKDIGRVELYKTQADEGRKTLSDIAQLRQLRDGVSYEGGLFAGPRSTVAGWMGYGGGQALEAKAADMQLTLSEKLKGAASDKDMAILGKGTPGISMSDAAAGPVLNGWEAVGLRAVERGKFFEAWMRTHKGLSGAQEAWDQFISERPILSTGAPGQIKVNRENVAAWRPYIGGGGDATAAPTGGASITGGAPRSEGAAPPPKAIEFLRSNRGRPGVQEQFDEKYGAGSAARFLGVMR